MKKMHARLEAQKAQQEAARKREAEQAIKEATAQAALKEKQRLAQEAAAKAEQGERERLASERMKQQAALKASHDNPPAQVAQLSQEEQMARQEEAKRRAAEALKKMGESAGVKAYD